MKALSVRPPWAKQIASGEKAIEFRSWPTSYRGELLICEGRGGGAVCVVRITDCKKGGEEPQFAHAWCLDLLYRVTSPPIKGKLGFFHVDLDTAGVTRID
jgi:ASCH domain